MARVAGSERDAEFEEFVVAQRGPLMRMARLLTPGDPALAEDLVQTTLTSCTSGGRACAGPATWSATRTTLTHAFIDETRRPFRRRELG